jgi:hypothetical protein
MTKSIHRRNCFNEGRIRELTRRSWLAHKRHVLIALDALKFAVTHGCMFKAQDVASPTGSGVITGATLQVFRLQTTMTPYFFLAAHLLLCAAAILARPSALTLWLLAGATPRLRGAV